MVNYHKKRKRRPGQFASSYFEVMGQVTHLGQKLAYDFWDLSVHVLASAEVSEHTEDDSGDGGGRSASGVIRRLRVALVGMNLY